jgi:two-component system osmolarity sensor histidine kinase EnvZ
MLPKRIDSLFLRLLLAQVLLVASAVLVFGTILVFERNRLLGVQYAKLFGPSGVAALRLPFGATLPVEGLDGGVQRRDALPGGFKIWMTHNPGVAAFIDAVKPQVIVDEVWLNRDAGKATLWVMMHLPGSQPGWVSVVVPEPLLPRWTASVVVGIALLVLVVALVSRSFSRRVTRPLARLRRRMQAHASTGIQPDEVMQSMASSQAPPELIAIDAAYRKLAQRLQRTERERALLLAGVSHDLRSPLSRIRLAAEMLPESADNAPGVASITRNVDAADRLTASFIEFIRAGVVPLNEVVDVAEAARRAVAGFDRSPHELSVRAPTSLLLQQAHGLLIERLVANLIDNALKHGRTPVEVEVARSDDAVVLTVSDAGAGLPTDGAGRLMEAFARGDASRNLPGFGLGLAIAQQTVERLQGELSVLKRAGRHQVAARLPLQR